jgi:hypothetical protein
VAISSDSIGLLFRAKGDTSDAKKAFSDLRSGINSEVDAITGTGSTKFAQFAQSMGLSEASASKLAGTMGGLAAGVGAAAAIMAAEVAVAIKVSEGLFRMAESAAEAGGKIKDMQDKTGLAAPLLSTLSINAQLAGSSLEQVGGGLVKFAKNIGDAASGNDKAQASMKALGVTTTDLDKGLKQAIITIANAHDGTEQINLAIKAFGKSGADLIPVIKQMGGDLEAAQKRAEHLGLTLSDADVDAADAFGDTLATLSEQVKVAGERFALEFAPEITKAMASISEFMARNQDTVREWGGAVASAISDIVAGFEWLATTAGSIFGYLNSLLGTNQSSWFNWKNAILNGVLALLGPLGQVAGLIKSIGEMTKTGEQYGPYSWEMNKTVAPKLPSGGGKGGGGGKGAVDQKADADLKAQLDLQKLYLKDLEEAYKESMTRVRDEFKKNSDVPTFIENANKANKEFAAGLPALLDEIDKLEQKLLKDPTTNQKALLDKQQAERREQIEKMGKDDVDKNNDIIEKFDEKRAENAKKLLKEIADFSIKTSDEIHDNLVKNANDEIEQAKKKYKDLVDAGNLSKKAQQAAYDELSQILFRNYSALTIEENAFYDNQKINLDAWKKKKEDEIAANITDEETRKAKLKEVNDEYERRLKLLNDIHDAETKSIEEKTAEPVDDAQPGFVDTIVGGLAKGANAVKNMQGVMQTFGGIALDVLNQVSQGVGNMVANFVLMGSAGTSFRKFVATILASVAQQAAVLAVMCLAYAALATTVIGAIMLGGSPHQFLIAAALFGAVAAGAAIAGRLVAGDSFKQQAAGEKSFAQTAGAGASDDRNKGGVYSSQSDQLIEAGRNTPGKAGTVPVNVTLAIRDKSDWFSQMFKIEWDKNGPIRQIIMDA